MTTKTFINSFLGASTLGFLLLSFSSCVLATTPWQGMSDEAWFEQFAGLADCPCSLEGLEALSDETGYWQPVQEANEHYHPGAIWEIRWVNLQGANGQQCTYDAEKQLITHGAGAGTPDIVSPSDPLKIAQHWWYDVRPFEELPLEVYIERWPPNQGRSAEGEVCPYNPPLIEGE